MQELEGKVAFVTGGGSGVALGQAKVLAGEAGMRVVIADVREDHLEQAMAYFAARRLPVHPIRLDITDRDAYVRAADEFGLSYADLKRMARASLEHDFLPGASLWARADHFTAPVAACARQPLGGDKPSSACRSFLDANPRAVQQWNLETRFRAFEAKW